MRLKQTTGAVLAAVVLLLGSTTAGYAMMGGGMHGGGFHGPAFHGGFHNGFHHGFDGHRSRVFIGGTVFLGDPFWWGPPPVYAPPVVVQQPAPVYTAPPATYWYYCPNPQGYYPYVQQCPPGWMTVVPPAP